MSIIDKINMQRGDKMIQTSKIALLTSVAVITMVMTGCGGSNNNTPVTTPTPVTPTPVTPTPETPADDCVPATLKVPATLNQNTTALTLRTALIGQDIGDIFVDGKSFGPSSAEKQTPKKVSKLASALVTKIQTLQKNTASIKKALIAEDGTPEQGDDIACDLSGTYSLSEENNNTSTGDEGNSSSTSTNKLTLSFNACVMDADSGSDALAFFEDMTQGTSIVSNIYREVSSSRTETFNGSVSLEYNTDYTYTSSSFNDNPTPQDDGTSSEDTGAGTVRFVSEGLSVEYKEDNITAGLFASTQVLSATFDFVSSRENNNSYETQTNEGNYTITLTNKQQYTLNASFEGNETLQFIGEVNSTTALSACNVTVESTINHGSMFESMYEDYNRTLNDEYNSTNGHSTKLSGYLVLQDGEEGLDLYADGLTVNYLNMSSNIQNDEVSLGIDVNEDGKIDFSTTDRFEETLSLSGTVGSTLIGGSVVLSTPSAWLMSEMYGTHRESVVLGEEIYDFFYPYVNYSPYAGSIVLTGSNTATVAFLFDAEDVTYGTITIQGQEPVEYDSIEAMGIAQILEDYDY